MRQRGFYTLLLSLIFSSLMANDNAFIIEKTGYLRIMPIYQNWTLDQDPGFSQLSLPLFVYYPIGRDFSITIRGTQAEARGDSIQTLSGITDTQLGLSYRPKNSNLVFNLGANVPTGLKELTQEEFQTSFILSTNIFKLRTPNFGQGLNLTAGLTWAFPITHSFVIGFGGSYLKRGGYRPLANSADEYLPGDEIMLTGGFDLRFNSTTTFSADLLFTTYDKDKIGDSEVFASGNKYVINAQFRKFFGFNEFWLLGRYRSRAKNQVAAVLGGTLVEESEKIFPDQLEFLGHFRVRMNRAIAVSILFEGRFYEQTSVPYSGIDLLGAGLSPEIRFSRTFAIPLVVKYLKGRYRDGSDLSGFELGGGIMLNY